MVGFAVLCPGIAIAAKPCLNNDAASQARLMLYEAEAPVIDALVLPENAAVSASTPSTADQRPSDPYKAEQISRQRLLDWNAWPALSVDIEGSHYHFMGVHVADKVVPAGTEAPCIRLAFKLFAPALDGNNVYGALLDRVSDGVEQRRITIDAVFAQLNTSMVAFDRTESFYVVDLDKLRHNVSWQKRYNTFKANVAGTITASSYPTYFERFLLNLIRQSRYGRRQITEAQRKIFVTLTVATLRKKEHVDCASEPTAAACMLNAALLETELGTTHPLIMSDALSNSGLSFGPRQWDLGQVEAKPFAEQYLITAADRAQRWDDRFFQPVERLSKADLKEMYQEVIRTFNDRLNEHRDQLLELYVTDLVRMVHRHYDLGRLQFSGHAAAFAQILAADFTNKWGSDRERTVASRLQPAVHYDECGFLAAWRRAGEGVAGDPGRKPVLSRDDLVDFERRSHFVVRAYTDATHLDLQSCAQ